jgi:hypothetical protein
MSRSKKHESVPNELQEVANALRGQRPELGPLELDRIKLRAMSGARRSTHSQKGYPMRSRLVTFLTIGALAVGSGSAIAGFEGGDGGGSGGGEDAGHHEYKPPCKNGEKFADQKCQKDDHGEHGDNGDHGH